MPGCYKPAAEKARGKAGRWLVWWVGADGARHSRRAYADRARSVDLMNMLDAEARQVRDGLVDPAQLKRRQARASPLAAHVRDYCDGLRAKGDTAKHVQDEGSLLRRLLADAGVESVAHLTAHRVRDGLGRWRETRSARRCNRALGAVKAFARWLADDSRIAEVPRGLGALKPYNEAADRRRVRRVLSRAEVAALLAAAEAGVPVQGARGPRRRGVARGPATSISGPDRAMLYRIAMGTGFRANELRTLAPECFRLDGDSPTITVVAAYSKRRRDDVQPIRRDLAAALRPWLEGRPPGVPVLPVPLAAGKLLTHDLAAAGIRPRTADGVVDLHSLRHSYITHLIADGVNPKVAQRLARHSTITLTLDRYAHVSDADVREALEGE
jgi:integrase